MKLTAADRKAMPKKEFAGPGRSFPIGDKTHARLAISGATRSERAGNISEGTADKIKAKARAKLGEGRGGNHEPKGNSRHFARGTTPTHEVSTADHFHKL
jgi:hypothetical protein